MKIYNFTDYKLYLNQKIDEMPRKGRGIKLKLAQYLGCQSSFVSQVLTNRAELNLEHAFKINRFFYHNDQESKFFLLLVQYSRAGTQELKQFFDNEIIALKKKAQEFEEKLPSNITELDKYIYYSSWYYAAIHMLVAIPKYRNTEAICKKLNLEPKVVNQALNFLLDRGLIVKKSDEFIVGEAKLFLNQNSEQTSLVHFNWRQKAIESIAKSKDPQNGHVSTILTLSKKDRSKAMTILATAFEEINHLVQNSKEEDVVALNIDFFSL